MNPRDPESPLISGPLWEAPPNLDKPADLLSIKQIINRTLLALGPVKLKVKKNLSISSGKNSGSAIRLYRDGLIGLGELEAELANLGYSEDSIFELRKSAELDRRRNLASLQFAEQRRLRRDGVISDDQYAEALRSIGYMPEFASLHASAEADADAKTGVRPSAIGLRLRAPQPPTKAPQRPSAIGLRLQDPSMPKGAKLRPSAIGLRLVAVDSPDAVPKRKRPSAIGLILSSPARASKPRKKVKLRPSTIGLKLRPRQRRFTPRRARFS